MTLTIGLIVLAVVAFLVAANWFRAGGQLPEIAQALGLALVALAVGVTLAGDRPDPPDPPAVYDSGGYRPHLQGFGVTAAGGRGGVICAVSRLTGSSAPTFCDGSLAGAFLARPGCDGTPATCAVVVVFNTSGTIDIRQYGLLALRSPYRTFAGQTAPAPGILIAGGTVSIETHDVVVQHLRIRHGHCAVGDAPALQIGDPYEPDTRYASNVIIDHGSVSWGCGTMNVAVNKGSFDVLTASSIFAEPLWPRGGDSGINHLTYSSQRCTATALQTYYGDFGNRGPWASAGCLMAILNNVGYNFDTVDGPDGTYGGIQIVGTGPDYYAGRTEVAILGNAYKGGPETNDPDGLVGVHAEQRYLDAGWRIRLADNTGPGIADLSEAGQQAGIHYAYDANAGNTWCDAACFASGFAWFRQHAYRLIPQAAVVDAVLRNAGARPTERDAVDARVVQHYYAGTGDATIASVEDVGGWPVLAVNPGAYEDPSDPNSAGDCGHASGAPRTRRECRLEQLAQGLEVYQGLPAGVAAAVGTR